MSLSEYNWQITTKRADETWDDGEYKIINDNSGGGTFGKDNSQAMMEYICEYTSHLKFLDVVLGKTVKVGSSLLRSASNTSFGGANGSLPEPHPYYKNFFAISATVKPEGKPTQMVYGPIWNKARVTVVFRPLLYNVIADGTTGVTEMDRFVTKVPTGQADMQTTQGFFRFVDSNPAFRYPLDLTPSFVVPSQRLMYTWHQIPCLIDTNGNPDKGKVPNIATITDLYGKVNDATFDGYAPGTVLFLTYDPKLVLPQVATDENYYWDITYTFSVKDFGVSTTPKVAYEHQGINYAFNPRTGFNKWQLYTTDGTTTGNPQYKYGTLSNLFAVTW